MNEDLFVGEIRQLVSSKRCFEMKADFRREMAGCGVYLFSVEDLAVYVGASENMFNRALNRNHHQRSHIPGNADLTFFPCKSIEDALRLESLLIDMLRPSLNQRKIANPTLDKLRETLGVENVKGYRDAVFRSEES